MATKPRFVAQAQKVMLFLEAANVREAPKCLKFFGFVPHSLHTKFCLFLAGFLQGHMRRSRLFILNSSSSAHLADKILIGGSN